MQRSAPSILATLLLASTFVVGSILVPRSGYAQDEVFPIITAEGAQLNPHVTYNARSEQFLLVWMDFDIHAHLLDRDGRTIGETMPLDLSSERQTSPMATAKTGTSSYLVTWQNTSMTGTDTDILGQIVDAGGPRLPAPIAVSKRPGRQADPVAAYCDLNNSFLTAWAEDEDAAGPWTFFAFGQRVSGDGDVVGGTAPITIDERPDDYAPLTRQQIELGFFVPVIAYVRAQQFRRYLAERMMDALTQVDALLSPTVAWVAPAEDPAVIGEEGASEARRTAPYNLTGFPAHTVLAGFCPQGLPIGLQIVTRPGADRQALALGAALEATQPDVMARFGELAA